MADEDDDLASRMEILASPVRLALLRELRSPRILSEIRVRADRPREGLNPERLISRQAVREHLDKLRAAGFVKARASNRRGHDVEEYLVDHTALFVLTEDLRGTTFVPTAVDWASETRPADAQPPPFTGDAPVLFLVHGYAEGRAFPLREGPIVIGRRPGLDVCLDYDPYVSAEHAIVRRTGKETTLTGLSTGRNGTFLNWRPLEPDAPAAIRPGDVIGVGRSLLVLR